MFRNLTAPKNNRTSTALASHRKTKPCRNTYCDKSDVLKCRCYTYFAHSTEKYHFLLYNTLLLQRAPCALSTSPNLSSKYPWSREPRPYSCFTVSSPFHSNILSVKSLISIANHWYCLKAKELHLAEVYAAGCQGKIWNYFCLESFHPCMCWKKGRKY